jgi:hypothetical protein
MANSHLSIPRGTCQLMTPVRLERHRLRFRLTERSHVLISVNLGGSEVALSPRWRDAFVR